MANICSAYYVIEGEKKELDALYETMKNLQDGGASVEYATGLGLLVKALGKDPNEVMCRGGWSELERSGDILRMTTEEQEQLQTRLIRGVRDGSIDVTVSKQCEVIVRSFPIYELLQIRI